MTDYPEGFARRRALVLGLLVAAYVLNFIDRTIISVIGQAIKVDLQLSDTELGLLGGLFFALFYSLLGLPIARLAERVSRTKIIAWSVAIWSGFTALCGTASNFATLALYRFGVGVGEAGLTPPAHSLISDYYEPSKRATALAIYSLGIPIGTMLGAMAGGWLTDHYSWRAAFIMAGLPGLLLALAFPFFVKEPPRGHFDRLAAAPEAPATERPAPEPEKPPFSLREELSEIRAVFTTLFGAPAAAHMIIGNILASFAMTGAGVFVPAYLIRSYGYDYATVGLVIGLMAGISQGIGTLLGGMFADRMAKRSRAWYALVPAIGALVAAPIYMAAFMVADGGVAVGILMVPGLIACAYISTTYVTAHMLVGSGRRATATAVILILINLISFGGGPAFTGWTIDRIAAARYAAAVDGTEPALSLLLTADTQRFKDNCPGGTAPAGAPAVARQQCEASLERATRLGLVLTFVVMLWAGLHFLASAWGWRRLSRAEAGKAAADPVTAGRPEGNSAI